MARSCYCGKLRCDFFGTQDPRHYFKENKVANRSSDITLRKKLLFRIPICDEISYQTYDGFRRNDS